VNRHATTVKVKPRSVSAIAVKAMLADGKELALVDVREELTFSQNHLLWARNVPLSRLELRFARLVPRKSTRIVLCDDNDGLAERAAVILADAGYSDLSCLAGGVVAFESGSMCNYQLQYVRDRRALPITRDYMIAKELEYRTADTQRARRAAPSPRRSKAKVSA